MSSAILLDHVTLLCDLRDEAARVLKREIERVLLHVTIPASCKPAILEYIEDTYGLRANRLYPDMAGLSGYLREDYRSQVSQHLGIAQGV